MALGPVTAVPGPRVIHRNRSTSIGFAAEEYDGLRRSIVSKALANARRRLMRGMQLGPGAPIPRPEIGQGSDRIGGDRADAAVKERQPVGFIPHEGTVDSRRRAYRWTELRPAAPVPGPRVAQVTAIGCLTTKQDGLAH